MSAMTHARALVFWLCVLCALAMLASSCTVPATGSGMEPQTGVDAGAPEFPDGGSGPVFPDARPDDDQSPCAGITCSGHGTCQSFEGVPSCVCDPGYVPSGLDCIATTPDSSGCLDGSGDYTNEGPYATTTSPGPSGFTVFHPTNLDTDCAHPIVAWGNGTGVNGTSIYAHLNSHLASWGIVVIASHNANVGSGSFHREGIDWLLSENGNTSSPFHGKLSPRAGVAGHSQGGIGASAAVTHANVEAEVNVQGGGSSADRAALLLTGTEDFMSSSIHSSYSVAEGPTFLASYRRPASSTGASTLPGCAAGWPTTRSPAPCSRAARAAASAATRAGPSWIPRTSETWPARWGRVRAGARTRGPPRWLRSSRAWPSTWALPEQGRARLISAC